MSMLNLAAFRTMPLQRESFEYLIVPGFVKPGARDDINTDFPQMENCGSFPVNELSFGPAFQTFLAELEGPEMRTAFEEKFRLDLKGKPTMITVRGRSGTKDGFIHTDAESKIITVLIYMNSQWESPGGQLRLLRSGHDIEDMIAEVPPVAGTLLAFRRSDNSWHGHKPFIGPRRVIQMNWITKHSIVRREIFRHRVSAWTKRLFGLFQPAKAKADHAGVGM